MSTLNSPHFNYRVRYRAPTRRVFTWRVLCLSCRKEQTRIARARHHKWEIVSVVFVNCDKCGNPPQPMPQVTQKRKYVNILRTITYMQPCEVQDNGLVIIP